MAEYDLYTIARFWAKVSVSDEDDACWPWRAAKSDVGYGVFRANGKNHLAHRFAYEFLVGALPPPPLMLLHRCDVRHCCNPAHLRPGTAQDNTDDMYQRGRARPPSLPGSHNGSAKLTETQAVEIYCDPRSQRMIAREYGVSQHAVWQIKNGKKWQAATSQQGSLL